MRIHYPLFHLSLLVSACFTTNLCAAAEEQEHAHADTQEQAASAVAAKGGSWSDPSTWSGGTVPVEGDIVTIGEGMDIVLDVSPPALHGMNLNGKLSFADDK